jgi:hypothetical protein
MVNVMPPAGYAGTPVCLNLPAGTPLFRIHQVARAAHDFNSRPSHRYYGGGRFDATDDDRYPFMYAGESVDVALTETLLRDLPPDDAGVLQLPRPAITGRRISAIASSVPLPLVSLCDAAALSAVSQDTWLVSCDQQFYAQSRHWAHWIRSKAPDAAGYAWTSHRHLGQRAFVLFGDRIPAGAITTVADPRLPCGPEAEFDTPRGRRMLLRYLSPYRVALSRR